MFENILKAKMKICKYSRNNQKSYDDALTINSNKAFDWVKTPCLFYFRSVKFHHVKETGMMLVAFWRTSVKIVVVFQHKRQRNKSFLCSKEPFTTMAESLRGNVFVCRESYFRGKACSKNNSLPERIDSRVQHIWRLRVMGP